MECPVCGAQNDATAAFCYQCGSALQSGRDPVQPATGPTVMLGSAERSPPDHFDRVDRGTTDDLVPTASPPGARTYQVPGRVAPRPYVVAPSTTMGQTSTLATVALILGIVSFILVPLIAAIGAVITGHMARREIRDAGGLITGDGLATAGLILGYLNLALCLLVFVGLCVLLL